MRPALLRRLLWTSALCATAAMAQTAGDRAISARLPGDFSALRERPLFSPDRSAPVVDVPAPEPEIMEEVAVPEPEPLPPATAPDWELVGLVRSERVNSAMFRALGEGVSFSLRQGESRDGWTLAEIGRFEVFLENGQGRAQMRFPEGAGPMPEL